MDWGWTKVGNSLFCSYRSLLKERWEWFATRAKWANRSFHFFQHKSNLLFCQKRAIRIKTKEFMYSLKYVPTESNLLLIALYQKSKKSDLLSLLFTKRSKGAICSLKRMKEWLALFGKKKKTSEATVQVHTCTFARWVICAGLVDWDWTGTNATYLWLNWSMMATSLPVPGEWSV